MLVTGFLVPRLLSNSCSTLCVTTREFCRRCKQRISSSSSAGIWFSMKFASSSC